MKRFKQIPNFPNYYIHYQGNVWSVTSKKYLKPDIVCGYYRVTLCKSGKLYRKFIHRLVLEVFVGFCPKGMECCHNNGKKTDNRLINLRWDTKSNNAKDAVRHGAYICGEKHYFSKLTEQDVRMIIYMWRTKDFTQREIAKSYNICFVTVNDIIHKRSWKHIWSK